MTDAQKLHSRDESIRKSLGWPGGFIAPKLPEPEADYEKKIREMFSAELENAVTIHVYDAIEMLERAFCEGVRTAR